MGVNGGKGARLFSVVPIGRHEAVNTKIKAQEIPSEHKNTRKHFLILRVVEHWSSVLREVEFSICGN